MFSLKAKYDEMLENHHNRKLAKRIVEAIRNQDLQDVEALWGSVLDKDKLASTFIPFVDIVTSSNAASIIMAAAIDTDNVEVLESCLKHIPDPNITMGFRFSSPVASNTLITSPLKYAVDKRKDNAVAFLAKHPDLDRTSGYNQQALEQSSRHATLAHLTAS